MNLKKKIPFPPIVYISCLLFIPIFCFFNAFLSPVTFCYSSYLSRPPINPINPVIRNSENNITTTFQDIEKSPQNNIENTNNTEKTSLHHIVFGIGASAKLWNRRKNYIKLWWRPNEMRGVVWLDKPVNNNIDDNYLLPPKKISSDTSGFKYTYPKGDRAGIRISRIVSENFRLGMEGVRWFVMGDDDTMFFPENLLKVLSKYDHNQYYYIGSNSETHVQNLRFSYNMAYGGGGFAISYPLAKALERIQDKCIQRYPDLYGSDERIQACLAELGVPVTKEPGFHQFDVHGNPFGLLAAHPITPLVSLHHLDTINPIFPDMDQVQALQRLTIPRDMDSLGLMQQSICYDKPRVWTISVSWGYAIQIIRGILTPREMELPPRTFLDWYRKGSFAGFSFNTRPLSKNTCQKPFVYYFSNATYDADINETTSEYVRTRIPNPTCKWKNVADPSQIDKVKVYKRPNPYLWDKSPRRNCCRILPTEKKGTLEVDVGACTEDEVFEL